MSVRTERMVLVGTEDGLRYHVEAKEWVTPLLVPFDPVAYQSVSETFSPFYPADPRLNLTVDAAWAGRLLQPDDVLH